MKVDHQNPQLIVINHTRDAVKWVFLVAMGASLAIAATKVFESFEYFANTAKIVAASNNTPYFRIIDTRITSDIIVRYSDSTQATESIFIFFLVFAPVFFRFYYGDIKFIDMHYDGLASLSRRNMITGKNIDTIPGLSRASDFVILGTHSVLIVFLANAIPFPRLFFLFFFVLLVVNSASLVVLRLRSTESRLTGSPAITQTQRLYRPRELPVPRPAKEVLTAWIANNSAHAAILFIMVPLFIILKIDVIYIDGAVIFIAFSNSAFDLLTTWEFYFPRLSEVPTRQ